MKEFDEFTAIMRRLRKECPWDKEQTHESLKKHFIEETYEAVDAIDRGNFDELKGELGDVALQVVFHSLIAEEQNKFTLEEVFSSITEKLIRRHPHVFGDAVIDSAKEQSAAWDKIKMTEGRNSILDGIPDHLPALMKAEKVQKKASKIGFDWKTSGDVWAKVEEELSELKEAVYQHHQPEIQNEFGDVLFALVNYSRFINVDPEESLRAAVKKFMDRFQFIEEQLKNEGNDIHRSTFEEMDKLWNEAKRREL